MVILDGSCRIQFRTLHILKYMYNILAYGLSEIVSCNFHPKLPACTICIINVFMYDYTCILGIITPFVQELKELKLQKRQTNQCKQSNSPSNVLP